MASMINSADVVRDLISDLSSCAKNLRDVSMNINTAAGGEWDDELSQAYSSAMRNVAQLVGQPVGTLEHAGKQLQQLAAAIERYSRIQF